MSDDVAPEEARARPPEEAPGPEPAADVDERLLRALADLDNLRKRYARELQRERDAERQRIARQWLPVVDDLERSLDFASAEDDPLVHGVRAVLDEALAVLARLGFPRFDDTGAPFDPGRHEAMGAVPSEHAPGTIVATVRPGYGEADELLRPAGVLVAQRQEQAS